MSTSLDLYLEKRLHEWARWCHIGNRINIGYPPENILYKIHKEGQIGRFNKVYQAIDAYINPKEESPEEQISNWVMDLQKYNPTLSDVLKARYLTRKRMPIKFLALKLNISHRTFEDRLRVAKNFLISRLIIFTK